MLPPAAADRRPWPAPAKLNLFLHVIGRRPDGYHLLQTAFQFLDLCDWLDFTLRDDPRIVHLNPLPGIPAGADLTVRAARLLQSRTGVTHGVDIRIDKRLPLGGGLGGGSSDAATTLWALNRLWGLGLGVDDLAEFGLQLGADVPVFIHGHAAWAEGVGERLTAIDPPCPWYLVVVPPVQVSTAAIFARPDLTRDCKPLKMDGFLSGGQGLNVCEPVVCSSYPEVAAALAWLRRHGKAAMSGTGSCVFLPVDSQEEAERLHRLWQSDWSTDWRGVVARGLNVSPLMDRVMDR